MIPLHLPGTSVKFGLSFMGFPAKMAKSDKPQKTPLLPLDTYSRKCGRGHPPRMQASEVSGRAYNYRLIFSQIGDIARDELLRAQTKEAVIQAFEHTPY